MKKLVGFIGIVVFAGVLGADNLVFNPGFDMTPWDTGWTIAQSGNGSGGVWGAAGGHSPPMFCGFEAEGDTGTYYWAEISQEVSGAVNCTCRIYYGYVLSVYKYGDNAYANACVAVDVKINGSWSALEWIAYISTPGPDWWASETTWTKWEKVYPTNDTVSGIRVYAYSSTQASSNEAADGDAILYVDDVYISGKTGVEEGRFFAGAQNDRLDACPNPFTQKTEIRVQNPEARNKKFDICSLTSDFCLTIRDLAGRIVRTLPITDPETSSGQSPITKITWDGTDESGKPLPTGVYFAKLITPEEKQTLKLILLR